MTLNKYYRISMFIPSGLVIAFELILGIVELIHNRDYKSEWLTDDSIFFISIIMVILNSIFMCILSLTIFLNNYKVIRQNIVLSALSWFFLTGMWIGFIWKKFLSLSYSQSGFDGESVFVISNTIPFVIGLIYTFLIFQLNERHSA